MKDFWLDLTKCSGCGACVDSCPVKAIQMKTDECGFKYPHITEKCINCNLCEKICKSRGNIGKNHFTIPVTYAAWSMDSNIRYLSTSGGVFSELALEVLKKKGVIAGAQYSKGNYVEHTLISDVSGLEKVRQSKYTQSDSNNIYSAVKEQLLKNRKVLFCGTPCQVAALYAFLKQNYDNLVTVDFICRGVNSPKAYKAWLDEIEQEEGNRITRVWFKYKDGGWKSSPTRTRLDFEDGHHIIKEGRNNLYMCGYLTSNLYIRSSCGDCDFKGVPRQGDITVADFWGVESDLDDDRGTSLVLINSEKGESLFNDIKERLVFHKRNFNEIFGGNVCFNESVKIPKNSKHFLRELDSGLFSSVLKRYTRPSLKQKIKRLLFKIIKRK